jgi:hypothetical protein
MTTDQRGRLLMAPPREEWRENVRFYRRSHSSVTHVTSSAPAQS